jgi:hypothetical protein
MNSSPSLVTTMHKGARASFDNNRWELQEGPSDLYTNKSINGFVLLVDS